MRSIFIIASLFAALCASVVFAAFPDQAEAYSTGSVKNYKLAVIPVRFQNEPVQPASVAQQLRDALDGSNSPNQVLLHSSWGNVGITGLSASATGGDVLSPLVAPIDNPVDCMNMAQMDALQAGLDSQAAAAGTDVEAYDRIAYSFPGCQYGESHAWANSRRMLLYGGTTWYLPGVMAHELIHTMFRGAINQGHAGKTSCLSSGYPAAVGTYCTSAEYGDVTDTMANSESLPSTYTRANLGLMDASNTVTATAPGEYDIASTALTPLPGSALNLRIPIESSPTIQGENIYHQLYEMGGSKSFLNMEYRQPVAGFPEELDTYGMTTNGATVRYGRDFGKATANFRLQSFRIDTDPHTSNTQPALSDYYWKPSFGNSADALSLDTGLYDPKNDVLLRVVERDSAHVRVAYTQGLSQSEKTTVTLSSGVLTVDARSGFANDIAVRTTSEGNLLVRDVNAPVYTSGICRNEEKNVASCSAAKVEQIVINSGDRRDYVDVDAPGERVRVDGGSGNDVLVGGSGSELFFGGDGADRLISRGDADLLVGGPGADTLDAGAGDDVISGSDSDADMITCGDGSDLAQGGPGDQPDASCESPSEVDTVIVSGPVDDTNSSNTSATIDAVASDDSAAFECRNDADAFAACSLPVTFNSLGTGVHSLEVRAVLGGVPDPTPAAIAYTVVAADVSGPDLTVSSPVGVVKGVSQTATFAAVDGSGVASVSCTLDGAPLLPCTSGTSVSTPTDGQHVLSVTATDSLGNQSTASAVFVVDNVAPSTNLYSPASEVLTANPHIGFAIGVATDVRETSCSLDGGAFFRCDPYDVITGLSEGGHALTLTVTDYAGNVATASTTFSVNTSVERTIIDSGPEHGSTSSNTSPVFTYHAELAYLTPLIECRKDLGEWKLCTNGPFIMAGLTNGSHTFSARSVDYGGSPDPTPATRTFTVDTLAPVVTIASPANGSTISNLSPPLNFSVSDASSVTTTCSLDSGPPSACPSVLGPLTTGTHTLTVQAVDAASNSASAVSAFTVTNPEVREISRSTAPTSTEVLTTQGTVDWSHWGRSTSSSWDHKAGGSSISNLTAVGGTAFTRVTSGVAPSVSWSGGTPTASSSATATGLSNTTSGVGRGYSFTIAGATSTAAMTMRLHVGVLNSRGKLELFWSSNPSNIVSDTSLSTTSTSTPANSVYQVTLLPPMASDTLNVRWTQDTSPSSSSSKVRIYSASLSGVAATRAAAPTASNLTTDGVPPGSSLDWAHWGGATSASTSLTPIGKSAATLISNATQVNGGTISQATSTTNPVTTGYSWTNGDSVVSASNIKTGIANTGGSTGRGFSFTVPADSATNRTLKLYVGATNSSATTAQPTQLDLYWGSSTIPVVTDVVPTFSSATNNYVYTINLKHPTAGTTLKAKWSTRTTSTSHKATLQSAVLIGG